LAADPNAKINCNTTSHGSTPSTLTSARHDATQRTDNTSNVATQSEDNNTTDNITSLSEYSACKKLFTMFANQVVFSLIPSLKPVDKNTLLQQIRLYRS